ncbi:MAG: phosphoribosylformylglycinamidine synthase subunit PurL [Defluviicoccus sp.]|nr:phosphoribosylformylglycinamidine synthase subunit PurL [Defluviicoccus sp.]MDG4607815.1 phosphoribosylformylglycinamidine synthase subunit PurL [Defluviicoccus sp.]
MTQITPALIAEHGLSADEYARILEMLGRPPSLTELGVYSVMWSEHCSYKSSKRWLKLLPTEAPWVLCGPGENAGVIDVGDGQAIIFKMESHNHPSFIEPYQGAATGVGGILRDVFTMGARPIANLNALRFGAADHPKTRHLVAGVVAGIGGYGNCVGVPTVGGECAFDAGYNTNILVNAMTVGLADANRIFFSAAAGPGSPIVYVGSKTGRDGIHGATMASAEFSEEAEAKRPTVQIGDPFTEKLLIEACLELMATDAIVAIQDMGAAGLTSSSFEMASKGKVGIALDLDRVPTRETGMTAYEIMLSESQERMLMVLKPEREALARAIFEKWDLDFAVVGTITDGDRYVAQHQGAVVIDLPVAPLASAAPEYDRPRATLPAPAIVPAAAVAPAHDPLAALEQLMGSPDLASRRWIWEQYDHMVMADTVQRPGGDAGVVRVHGTSKGVALACDCTPRYCEAEPVTGGRQAVAETWRNLTAVGARPLAITNCLNFGNPEKPEIMAQFAGCITGMRDACEALAFPVVSGNVSLYNETNGIAIPPTPTIGGVGLIDDLAHTATLALKAAGEALILIGKQNGPGWLGQSLYARQIAGRTDGAPPPVDLTHERMSGDFVRTLIKDGRVVTCHDIADGGLLVAVAEMAMAGNLGLTLTLEGVAPETCHAWLFGEDQGRYVIACPAAEAAALIALSQRAGVAACVIGRTGGSDLTVEGQGTISVASLRDAHERWLPGLMAAPATEA